MRRYKKIGYKIIGVDKSQTGYENWPSFIPQQRDFIWPLEENLYLNEMVKIKQGRLMLKNE